MARHIDADKFIDWLDIGHLRSPSEICYSEGDVKVMIDSQPTADVVEVVRCKDCILHEEGCPLDTHPCMTVDDGYCYLAKRTPKERSESDG